MNEFISAERETSLGHIFILFNSINSQWQQLGKSFRAVWHRPTFKVINDYTERAVCSQTIQTEGEQIDQTHLPAYHACYCYCIYLAAQSNIQGSINGATSCACRTCSRGPLIVGLIFSDLLQVIFLSFTFSIWTTPTLTAIVCPFLVFWKSDLSFSWPPFGNLSLIRRSVRE